MVADALVYHPTVAHYLKFVGTTVGRDKVLRTLQYFARFYAWYLYRTNASEATIKPWSAMKSQFGKTRKIMRMGKFLEHFKAAAVAFDAKNMDPVVKYLTIGRQLGYAGYLSLDFVNALDAAGIRPTPNSKKIGLDAYRFWMYGLIFSVMNSLYSLMKIRQQFAAMDRTDGEKAVESKKLASEQKSKTIQLIQDLLDLCSPTAALGYTNFDDGFCGIAGTISSLIGVRSQWKKTA
ncbi:peroxisomal membrane protein-like protein [Aulographum hederae CBS 113979]|uniref:Peroxisomal membrane protein-like protein n=1 Tax=Aulographum hederae CBS 113979 TaxID=1176131 RepID=A0A6G1GVJ9_9PEZI|nr:peroxisomal membrane protein-like protein [Aulographum hederae CBS 113979]